MKQYYEMGNKEIIFSYLKNPFTLTLICLLFPMSILALFTLTSYYAIKNGELRYFKNVFDKNGVLV